jgi:hypothetical protein
MDGVVYFFSVRLPIRKGSSVVTCPHGFRFAPGAGDLWHRHVPRGPGHATRLGRAMVSLCIPRLQTPLLVREGSGITTCGRACCPTGKGSGLTTCPTAPDLPPGAVELWRHHVRPDPPSGREGLRCHHVSHCSRPAFMCRRAMESPRAAGPAA